MDNPYYQAIVNRMRHSALCNRPKLALSHCVQVPAFFTKNPQTRIGRRPQNDVCGTLLVQVPAFFTENPPTWTGRRPQNDVCGTLLVQVPAFFTQNPPTWIGRRPQNDVCGTLLVQVPAFFTENPQTWTGRRPQNDEAACVSGGCESIYLYLLASRCAKPYDFHPATSEMAVPCEKGPICTPF